jgi:hypothetical protein
MYGPSQKIGNPNNLSQLNVKSEWVSEW